MQINKSVSNELRALARPDKAEILMRFFKTAKGEYGHGDVFIGVTMPQIRQVAKRHADLEMKKILDLLRSRIHEERMCALVILTGQYMRAVKLKDVQACNLIFRTILKNRKHVNNWDLVDVTIPGTVGAHLFTRSRALLYRLARSKNLWERRIAIVATLYFIRKNDFKDTLKISEMLLQDEHDLIHKASGWMLREVGKRDEGVLCSFLERFAARMPRTMLRYSIERLSPAKRKRYMQAKA